MNSIIIEQSKQKDENKKCKQKKLKMQNRNEERKAIKKL